MKIHCPLNSYSLQYLDRYIELGADEFYFGYRNSLSKGVDLLNRRFGDTLNFDSPEAAVAAISRINSLGKKAFVALNEQFFPPDWYDSLVEDAEMFAGAGAAGIIVADINLLLALRESGGGIPLVLSSVTHILNSGAIDFFSRFDVDRIVLPRQLTVKEIDALTGRFPDIQFELIIANEECPFLEGVCCYSHRIGEQSPNICRQFVQKGGYPQRGGYVADSCGACALFALRGRGDLVLKIAGRGNQADWTGKDVRFYRQAISYLDEFSDAEKYTVACSQLHFDIYGDVCRGKCYYNCDSRPPEAVTGRCVPTQEAGGVVKFSTTLPFPSVE